MDGQVLYYAVWLGGSALAGWIGRRQGRNPLTCFVGSVVVTPVVAIPVLLWIGPKRDEPPADDAGR